MFPDAYGGRAIELKMRKGILNIKTLRHVKRWKDGGHIKVREKKKSSKALQMKVVDG